MKKIHGLYACLIFAVLLCLGVAGSVRAQEAPEQPCGGYEAANAFVKVAAGSYDIYAKFNEEKTEQASLFTLNISEGTEPSSCTPVATTQVTGSSFTKMAGSVPFSNAVTQLYFASPTTKNFPTAAAPQIILVPSGKAVCDVGTGCSVEYEGQSMNLSPRKLSLSSDSIVAGILLPLESEKVDRVVYSVDGKPAYESKNLELFNERYVSGGAHTLVRRVVFVSGATLSDSRAIERGTFADVNYLFQSVFYGQSKLIKIVTVGIALFVVWTLLTASIRFLAKRRNWQQGHTAGKGYKIDAKKTGAQTHFYDESMMRTLYRYRKLWVGVIVFAVGALAFVTYGIGFFTVDGISMDPTLKDTSVHPLVKIQKSLARINRSELVPKRGDIVVIQKDESNLFDADVVLPKSYVVKRTIGLPGERVTLKQGKVLIYNDEHKDGFDPDATYKWITDLTGSEEFNLDITLKDSEIFVIGDNRDDSIDSRFYGPVNVKEVVGKVIP